MLNVLASRFKDTAAFVSPDMSARFDACLAAAAAILIKIQSDVTKPTMEDDFWFDSTDWRCEYRPYIVKDGILQIPVKGVLLHDFPYAFGDYATGYPYIWRAYQRGMDDGQVKGIALVVDSPGGEVAGNFDLVDKMFARRDEKEVRAYAAESMYSAAYSIGSVASKIIVSRTGGVGSIGVVTGHVDMSGALEQRGFKVTFIYFGKHKVD
jgi:ClpP class serine protease